MLCDNGGMLFNLIEKKANKNLPLSQPAKYIPKIDEYVMGLMNGTVVFYDKTGLKIKSFNCEKGYLLRLVVDDALLLYNPKTGINQLVDFNFKKIVEFKSQSANSLFVYSSPLKTIFQAWHESAINCYNISTNKTADIYTHDTKKKGYKEQFQSNDFGIHRMTLSPDGMFLAVASTYNKNVLWDLSKLTKFDLIGHNCNPRNTWDGVRSVSFSQNSEYVLTSADDYSSIIWDKAGEPLSRLKGHKRKVIGSSFFDNDSGIVSISLDNTLKIWRK
jgi:WD40 repeat protein